MKQTLKYKLPYPEETDTTDVPRDIKSLAEQTENVIFEQTKNKVDKVPGKQLSTEDFTTAYKQQLDSLETKLQEINTKLSKAGNTLTKRILNKTITGGTWIGDPTFPEYPFKADIVVEGVTEADWKCVGFYITTKNEDLVSSIVFVGNGIVRFYASENIKENVVISSMDINKVLE